MFTLFSYGPVGSEGSIPQVQCKVVSRLVHFYLRNLRRDYTFWAVLESVYRIHVLSA